MLSVLQEIVVPALRDKGFTGSLPHFRRLSEGRTDLLTVQFSRFGGQFVVEIAVGPAWAFDGYDGKTIEPSKMTAYDIVPPRRRIGPKAKGQCDYWYIYEGKGAESMKRLAERVRTYVETEAELYWEETVWKPRAKK